MPRKARVVTMSMGGEPAPTVQRNMERVLGMLDSACTQDPDIVCLPEAFATAGIRAPADEHAETVPGPTTDACARRARQHRTYVVCPLITRRDGEVFNSAVILDRSGQVAGIYDKVHPVVSTADVSEIERGVTPGSEAPVFELDFGRVGCQICFDLGYPETWKQLADGKAELVFWPSAYDGGFPLRVFAYLHKYYVVSSVRTSHAKIINPLGEVLAATDGAGLASHVIDLDFIVCHLDFHQGIPEKLREKYGEGVSVRTYDEESHFLLESNREDLPLAKLVEDFGLEDTRHYHARHLPAYEALRAGRKPKPQDTPYHDRPK